MKNKFFLLLLPFVLILMSISVAAQEDSVPAKEIVKLSYFNDNNSMQYLIVQSILKKGKVIEPQKNKPFDLFLDSIKTGNLIGKTATDKDGKAKCFLPTTLKTIWEATAQHKFIAVTAGKEEPAAELDITKAKIQIDTSSADGARNITVQVMKFENNDWIPVKDVEMKVGVQRIGGVLSAGDEATYTTDSAGTVTVAVTKDSLPGDEKGNIVLAAKVEDNDMLGNLYIKKQVPWGVAVQPDKNFFNQRTLWSTRFKTPYWLLFMAYSIVLAVWGTIIYLVMQIVKINKLGKQ